MLRYRSAGLTGFNMDNWTCCNKCQTILPSEQAWIADEGVLCPSCCAGLYGNTPPSYHVHEWKEYVGFRERYWFCDCGAKK